MRWSLERNSYISHTKINQTALAVLLMILDLVHCLGFLEVLHLQYNRVFVGPVLKSGI